MRAEVYRSTFCNIGAITDGGCQASYGTALINFMASVPIDSSSQQLRGETRRKNELNSDMMRGEEFEAEKVVLTRFRSSEI